MKIAVIDSGIDNVTGSFNIFGGISFLVDEKGYIITKKTFKDNLGHGTMCVSVINKECPSAEFYIVKIFENELETYEEVLLAALNHLIDIDVDLISLSLSITGKFTEYFDEVLLKLESQGKLIFWSKDNTNKKLFLSKKYGWAVEKNDRIESIMFSNKDKKIFVNSMPYLHLSISGEYKLFGKTTSYCTAKAVGIIARVGNGASSTRKAINGFIQQNREEILFDNKHFYPKSFNSDRLFNSILDILENFFHVEKKTLLQYSLFSKNIANHSDFCFELIKTLETEFKITLQPYDHLSQIDFISAYSIYDLIKRVST